MVQVIHQFCAAKNKQIQEYSDNQNAPQTTAVDQPSNTVPPPAYPQQQTVTIQAPPNQSQPQGAPQGFSENISYIFHDIFSSDLYSTSKRAASINSTRSSSNCLRHCTKAATNL